MNKYMKLVAVMAALSAGAALAAGTTAGTQISNTATATFNDAGGTPVTGTVTTANPTGAPSVSNTVTTTVQAAPSFTITPNDGGTLSAPNPNAPGQQKADVTPGSTQAFKYTVTNSGNTPIAVTLNTLYASGTSDTNSAISGTATVTGVAYYLDSNNNGTYDAGTDTAITGAFIVPLDDPTTTTVDESAPTIFQVYTVPTAATPGQRLGADPQGSAKFDPAVNTGGTAGTTTATYTSTVTVTGSGTGTYQNTDSNNFNRVTVYTPVLTNNPQDGNTATTTIDPSPTNVTPPGSATPVPGYTAQTDPNSPGSTPIVQGLAGNEQKAYPPADTNTANDVVRFSNTVVNTGTLSDTVNLFPTDGTGAPIGTNTSGVFSNVPGLPTGTTVQFLDTSGNALPLVGGYPTLTVPANGEASYVVKVTYPDSDTAALPAFTTLVGVDSGNDAGVVADATTKDTIYPPFLEFGDATAALGADPTQTPNVNVYPGTPATGLTDGATDARAVFPMDVANTGTYAEAYTLSGSVTVPLTTGANSTLTVSYYKDVNGNGALDAGDTLITGGVTASVAAGTEIKVLAAVDVPANMLADGLAKALTQTATGNTSGVVRTDTNDTITAKISGNLGLKKFADNCGSTNVCPAVHPYTDTPVAASTAIPGDYLRYELVAQNNTNAAVQSVTLSDDFSVNNKTNLTLVSLSASTTVAGAKVLYRIGTTGAWTAITGTTALPANTSGATLQFWYDGNGNGAADSGAADALSAGSPNGAGFTVNINTQVK